MTEKDTTKLAPNVDDLPKLNKEGEKIKGKVFKANGKFWLEVLKWALELFIEKAHNTPANLDFCFSMIERFRREKNLKLSVVQELNKAT